MSTNTKSVEDRLLALELFIILLLDSIQDKSQLKLQIAKNLETMDKEISLSSQVHEQVLFFLHVLKDENSGDPYGNLKVN